MKFSSGPTQPRSAGLRLRTPHKAKTQPRFKSVNRNVGWSANLGCSCPGSKYMLGNASDVEARRGLLWKTFCSRPGIRLAPGLTSLDHDDDFDFVDVSGDVGKKAASTSRAVYEVLRLDSKGKCRTIYVKRRDLLRTYGLLPRDLRRIDPAWDKTRSSETIVIKEQALLLNLGGVRCIVTSDKALLFEHEKPSCQKFLDVVIPRLQSSAGRQLIQNMNGRKPYTEVNGNFEEHSKPPPFELEVMEGALIVATGKLDAELIALMRRASGCLTKLPSEVSPITLEELRRTKQACVELESKAENLREVLEEILDDEEEIAQINLSSRPVREARQRKRERNRLRREQTRTSGDHSFQNAQDALEEMEDEEEMEREVEEVEDMLEYYLQRGSITQSEAERVLAGARDLEESIGVSLSARRFEVNRLELMLSMGSFAAALGAMIAGIFGMNMRNTLELSVWGFYGITGAIVLGCVYVFFALLMYTKKKSIV